MTGDFLRGAIAMGFAIAALFFLRYWRESRDRLFAWFALAFFVLALTRTLLVLAHDDRETAVLPYLVRLLAFLIFLGAILDKNLSTLRSPAGGRARPPSGAATSNAGSPPGYSGTAAPEDGRAPSEGGRHA